MADGTITIDVKIQQQKAAAELAGINAKLEGQKAKVDKLKEAYDKLEKAAAEQRAAGSVSPETEAALNRAKANLDAAAEKMKLLELEAERARGSMGKMPEDTKNTAKNLSKASDAVKAFSSNIGNMMKGALIFKVFSDGINAAGAYLRSSMAANEEYTASLNAMKGSLLALIQPLYNLLVPVLTAVIGLVAKLTNMLVRLLSLIFGKDYAAQAKALYAEAQGIDAVGKAAKKAQKSLAGFDELNQIGGQSDSSDGGGQQDSGASVPDFGMEIGDKINALEMIVSGALLAVGAILTFTGTSIPLGIALMAAGAAGLVSAVALNWDSIRQELEGSMGAVLAGVSIAFLVLGAIFAFSGAQIGLGIALMVMGATGLATAAALNWDTIEQALQGPVGRIVALASGALLVLGLILAFSGAALPLGIALMVAGAAGLATVAAVNWDAIKDKITGAWDRIKQWWNRSVAPIFTKQWWAAKFSSISDGLKTKIKDGINSAIALLNRFVDWVNDKLNISWKGLSIAGTEIIPAGSFQLLKLPRIPALAEGAVIPPNREFLAVLGDQTSGTNIETPLQTMIDAFRAALQETSIEVNSRVYLDGEDITNNTVRRINDRTRRGMNPLLI